MKYFHIVTALVFPGITFVYKKNLSQFCLKIIRKSEIKRLERSDTQGTSDLGQRRRDTET